MVADFWCSERSRRQACRKLTRIRSRSWLRRVKGIVVCDVLTGGDFNREAILVEQNRELS
jgi:hypothetical protein